VIPPAPTPPRRHRWQQGREPRPLLVNDLESPVHGQLLPHHLHPTQTHPTIRETRPTGRRRRWSAGRGRPPQAAARRAGLEFVEKLLTTKLESAAERHGYQSGLISPSGEGDPIVSTSKPTACPSGPTLSASTRPVTVPSKILLARRPAT
jgi:hypothetical protein